MSTVNIAGGGIMGLSCAWRLAQHGHSVTVFDSQEAGREASFAAAGMLAPGGEIDSDPALAAMALRSQALFPEYVRELAEASGIAIEYRPCGAIEAGDAATLARKAERQEALGIHSEPCRHGDFDARFYPGDSVTSPCELVDALIVACRRAGVTIREHEPVTGISEDGGFLRTANGRYDSDRLLIAAGAWSSGLRKGLPRSYPVRGHLLAYNVEPGTLQTILRHGHTYVFQRQRGPAELIAGSSTEDIGFDRSISNDVAADLQARAAQLLPMLGAMQPFECWNGFRPAIEGAGPAIGPVAGTSIWTAYGHYRNGILLAPETARIVAAGMN